MKTDTRYYLGWGARLRLVGRILGITALFAALGGLFLLWAVLREITVGNIQHSLLSATGTAFVAALLIVVGGAFAAMILLIELLAILGGSGQRSATRMISAAQIILATAVFGGLNYFAFDYFKRWDLTRNHQFTLPTAVADELRKLDGKTTIVVLQQHKTFGQLSPKPDNFDYAAERKVVEKVKDLVEEFRQLGPLFRVVTLDVEADGYEEQLNNESLTRPGLKEAVAAAPENSIFFYPDERVRLVDKPEALARAASGQRVFISTQEIVSQENPKVWVYEGNIPRLSFNEFYQLDKTASKAANPGPDGKPRGNLVLRPQGVESFARRVLAIQEKRPKVGVLVIHEALSTNESEGWPEQYTSSGLRKVLEDHGCDVVDVLLKKWTPREGPAPAAYNLEETRFDRLDAELRSIETQLRALRKEKERATAFMKELEESTLEELNKKYRVRLRQEVTEDLRQRNIRLIKESLGQVDERAAELDKDRVDTEAKVKALMRNERAFEDRRVTDLRAKMDRLVAECDLLIIPRHTLINISIRPPQFINPPIYRLSAPQIEVIKEFMKKGKPVLACIGPNNDPETIPGAEPLDDFERLIAERGIELGRQTILFDSEMKGFAAREAGDALGGSPTEIPPVTFPAPPADKQPNPIAKAMRAVADSADQHLELRIRHPRPIYLDPVTARKSPFATDFMATVSSSWNEEQPFPSERPISAREIAIIPPRYEATQFDDPKRGTRDEVRRGPFPVGVAIETTLPVEWFEADYGSYKEAGVVATPLDGGLLAACLTARSQVQQDRQTKSIEPQTERKKARLAVIGQGGVFTGKQLNPAQEQLLLHTCNWLLKRDDRLPRTDTEWTYPRVNRDEKESFVWKWGPTVGLPMFFLYLGLIVWIVRRVR